MSRGCQLRSRFISNRLAASFTTIFTHKGALEELRWNWLASAVELEQQDGGIVYIAGYFRTRLYEDLHDRLRQLVRSQIVVLDHGQLLPQDSHDAVAELRTAFRQKEVDVYICTLAELQALAHHPRPRKSRRQPTPSIDYVDELASSLSLPPVTVVRDEMWPGSDRAFLLLEGDGPELVDTPTRPTTDRGPSVSTTHSTQASFTVL